MRTKILLAAVLCFGLGAPAAHPQLASPYSNSVFPAKILTATGQTSAAIQLNGLVVPSTIGSSFASGTITLTGSSLTTVTFAVMGSSDNGATYYALPIYIAASPTTSPATTITATANGLYQVNLAGLTHIKFVTSGTFTATSVTMTLTASPNAMVSRQGGSCTTGGDVSGACGSQIVTGLQGHPVSNTAPTTGQQLQWDGTHYTPSTPGGDPYVYVSVAASNSVNRLNANFQCTGTNDQTCINNAIATCPATLPSSAGPAECAVVLQPGVYNLSGSILVDTDDVTLTGQGHCDWGGYNGSWGGTGSPAGSISTGCVQLKATASGFPIIQVNHFNLAGTGVDSGRHRGLLFQWLYLVGFNYGNEGILDNCTAAGGDDNSRIIDNNFQRLSNSIDVCLDSPEISLNSIQDNSGDAIIAGFVYPRIHDNLIYDIGGNGITMNATGGMATENVIGDTAGVGIAVNANHVKITGNALGGNALGAIKFTGSRGSAASGNTVDNFDTMFGYAGGIYGKFPNAYPAIYGDASSGGLTISGNTIDSSNPSIGNMTGAAIQIMGPSGTIGPNTILGCWSFATTCGAGIVAEVTNTIVGNTYSVTGVATPVLVSQYKASAITGVSSGGSVTTWPDSGSRNIPLASIGTPPLYESTSTIHSGPAVRFNGIGGFSNDSYTIPLTSSLRTVFSVVNFSSLASTLGHNEALFGSYFAYPSTNFSLGYLDSAANKLGMANGNSVVSTLSAMTTGSSHVLEYVFGGPASTISIDGNTEVTIPNSGEDVWSGYLYLGTDEFGDQFVGDMAETDIYTGAMNATQSTSAGGALCTTYGVTCGTNWVSTGIAPPVSGALAFYAICGNSTGISGCTPSSSTTIWDGSGSGNNATWNTTPTYNAAPGTFPNPYDGYFNLTYATLTTPITLSGDFTIVGWQYSNTGGPGQILFGNTSNADNLNSYGGNFRLYVGGADQVVDSAAFPINTWVCYAVTRTSGALALYHNGTVTGTGSYSSSLLINTIGFSGGTSPSQLQQGNVGIYGTALTSGQITTLCTP